MSFCYRISWEELALFSGTFFPFDSARAALRACRFQLGRPASAKTFLNRRWRRAPLRPRRKGPWSAGTACQLEIASGRSSWRRRAPASRVAWCQPRRRRARRQAQPPAPCSSGDPSGSAPFRLKCQAAAASFPRPFSALASSSSSAFARRGSGASNARVRKMIQLQASSSPLPPAGSCSSRARIALGCQSFWGGLGGS